MQLEDDTLTRDGKYPVSVGDYVHVDGLPDSATTTNGWYNGKVVRFWRDGTDALIADVTKPKHAGIRCVNADRLTKQNGVR